MISSRSRNGCSGIHGSGRAFDLGPGGRTFACGLELLGGQYGEQRVETGMTGRARRGLPRGFGDGDGAGLQGCEIHARRP